MGSLGRPTATKYGMDEKLGRRLVALELTVNERIGKAVETLSELLKAPSKSEPKETAQARDELALLEDDPEVVQMLNVLSLKTQCWNRFPKYHGHSRKTPDASVEREGGTKRGTEGDPLNRSPARRRRQRTPLSVTEDEGWRVRMYANDALSITREKHRWPQGRSLLILPTAKTPRE
ncbi:hypothetical protein Y032_0086g1924 [Ancylostoma ceylanicum]|uniref:Uncharacterized protein n=1 Tax=Ancylostoma ceylanicum TaxID=53326 RepID=A0A016TNU8_9BILA|nr:hypothetical protein Y032_0086g1924 [Ancylostoma ceylanicum]